MSEPEESDECSMCHKTMLTDDGCEPTDICHNCAHERIAAIEAQVNDQRQMIADLREENAVFVDSSRRFEAQNRQLREALNGLFARHKDGSEEQYWAEWDTALDAMEEKK